MKRQARRTRRFFVGVDLGGTNVRAGAVLPDGMLLDQATLRTEVSQGTERVLANIEDVIIMASKAGQQRGLNLEAVGVAVPGPLDSTTGTVYNAPNFPQWTRFPLRRKLAGRLRAAVFLDNDGNCAALGEHWVGAGAGCDNMAVLTLGTGVGGGIIVNGQLLRGAEGFAGEVGHVVVNVDGAACNCGGRGCLEAYSSATGLKRMLGASLGVAKLEKLLARDGRLDVRAVAAKARAGDQACQRAFATAARALGAALASFVNLFNLEVIVIAGGMAGAWSLIVPPARAEMLKRAFPRPARRVHLLRAGLGTAAGVVGAARLAMLRSGKG